MIAVGVLHEDAENVVEIDMIKEYDMMLTIDNNNQNGIDIYSLVAS